MPSLDSDKLAEMAIPVATGWLLGACMEARGKQDLWIRQKPEALAVLREQAIIQSEGVTMIWLSESAVAPPVAKLTLKVKLMALMGPSRQTRRT